MHIAAIEYCERAREDIILEGQQVHGMNQGKRGPWEVPVRLATKGRRKERERERELEEVEEGRHEKRDTQTHTDERRCEETEIRKQK